MTANRREFLLGAATLAAGTSLPSFVLAHDSAETSLAQTANSTFPFQLEFDGAALTSLRFAGDAFPTNYIATGQKLDHIEIAWRRPNGPWQKFHSAEAAASADSAGMYQAQDDRSVALTVAVRLEPRNSVLRWTVDLSNSSSDPIEIGDLALPLPMHSSFNGKEPPTASVLKHSFVSGHGSFLFWMRSNSVGPYLVMTPERNTALEYWDHVSPAKGRAPGVSGLCAFGGCRRSRAGNRRALASAANERYPGARWQGQVCVPTNLGAGLCGRKAAAGGRRRDRCRGCARHDGAD
jgi:hypothetical protein